MGAIESARSAEKTAAIAHDGGADARRISVSIGVTDPSVTAAPSKETGKQALSVALEGLAAPLAAFIAAAVERGRFDLLTMAPTDALKILAGEREAARLADAGVVSLEVRRRRVP
jgi:hypothetical protein